MQVKNFVDNAAGKNAIREKALRLNDDLENWIDIAHEAFMGCDDELEKARLDGKIKEYWELKSHVEEMLEIDTKIDWSKVPIDTPIWVRGTENAKWRNRYFAGIKDGYEFTDTADGGLFGYRKLAGDEKGCRGHCMESGKDPGRGELT